MKLKQISHMMKHIVFHSSTVMKMLTNEVMKVNLIKLV